MNLLERYLQAIGQYLPSAAREDTLAELRANLLEQMDARSEELGHPLTEGEVAAILKAHGRPEVVAARYLPQQSLIGPALFPSYILTLRKALPFVVFVYCIVRSMPFILAPNAATLARDLAQAVLQFFPTLLLYWAIVTLVFAVFEFVQSRLTAEERWSASPNWDPRELPPVKAAAGAEKTRSLASRIADLTVHCFWMIYVVAIPSHPYILLGPGVYYLRSLGVGPGPAWHIFLTVLLALLVTQLVMKMIALLYLDHPWIEPLKLITNLLGVAGCCVMAFAHDYFVPLRASADLERIASVNHAMGLAFRVALFFAILGLLIDGWKSIKRFIQTEQLVF